jgi:hexosaminidase
VGLAPGLRASGSPCRGLRVRVEPGAAPAEGYTLLIEPAGATIAASTTRGVRYALLTLRQLLRAPAPTLAPGLYTDAPAFAVRGVMLDVSRDRVPTNAELRRTVDTLADLKFNQLQLYTEHTFAYAGHEDAWRDASPLTPEDVRALDSYAASRGVELAANQNCFGHLASWLRLPRYAHLAETHGDWKFMTFDRSGPFSLCPIDPASVEFVRDLLTQLLPNFASPVVNIGCDETFDVGGGRSKDAVERRGKAAVYFEFVRAIASIAAGLGKRSMLWADMALSHPESLGLMPEDAIGVVWGYEPGARFGEGVERLRGVGREAWVAPGTSSWRSFTGRTSERRANIAEAGEEGLRAGATGFLVCDWGDLGHRQTWPIALHALAHAAEAAWNPSAARGYDARAGALHAFGEDPSLGPWLDELGDVDRPIRLVGGFEPGKPIKNATALFNDLHPPIPPAPGKRSVNAERESFEATGARLRSLASRTPSVRDSLVRRELAHTLGCCELAWRHAASARATTPFADADDLAALAETVRREHESLWPERSRPGGLEHSSSYYTKVIDDLRGARPR